MPPQKSASLWTIRCRYHSLAVCLLVNPSATITAVKTDLLEALREAYPDGIKGKPLPEKPESLILAQIDRDESPADKLAGPPKQLTLLGPEFGQCRDSIQALGVVDEESLAFQWDCEGPMNPISWGLHLPTMFDPDGAPTA